MARQKKTHDPFRWFDSSPEVIRLVVLMYVRSHGDFGVKSSEVSAHLCAPAAAT
jgi:hypothetical protein